MGSAYRLPQDVSEGVTDLPLGKTMVSLGANVPSIAKFMDAFEEMANELVAIADTSAEPKIEDQDPAAAYKAAKKLLATRRRRDRVLGGDLFSDPVWNILLDLFISEFEQKKVAVGDACIAADVPVTSALRCCRLLEIRGFIRRERDPLDGRRMLVRLSDTTRANMTVLFLGTAMPKHYRAPDYPESRYR